MHISTAPMDPVFDNVYSNDQLKYDLTRAFLGLDDILIEHCGPFASSCVIGSKYRQVNDVDEFTKDGIKILRHLIVSEEASSRFAARMARFIGIAVDKRCHDGTTTSMLLFCRLARLAIEKMDGQVMDLERYRWSKTFFDLLTIALESLKEFRITEEDMLARCEEFGIETSIPDVRAAIAYHMAMISSKGDDDLSSKVAAVIRSAPKKIYGMFKDTPLAVETEEPYILKKQDYDLALNANLGHIQHYNHKNDTQYLSENAVIFSTGNDIVKDSMESIFLEAFISTHPRHRPNLRAYGVENGWEHFHEGRRNLIILTPMLQDPELITAINLFNMDNPDIKISWFNVQVHGRMRTSLNKTLHYLAGAPLFHDVMRSDATQSLVGLQGQDVRVHFLGHTMTISNTYKKDGNVFHPLYSQPELFEPYTRFRVETEDLIQFASENVTNPALDPEELTYLTSLYRSLTCQEIYDIEVGGSAHDQYANRTVYEDAIGAALSAVNEGVVLGGYAHLGRFFRFLHKKTDVGDMAEKFSKEFLSVVLDSLRVKDDQSEVTDLIHLGLNKKWSYVVADTDRYLKSGETGNYIELKTLEKETLEEFLKMTPGVPVLLQAYAGYHEQFRRFRDILPKLANTTHLADMRLKDGADVR